MSSDNKKSISDPLSFLSLQRKNSLTRSIKNRSIDFKEISLPLSKSATREQASRCLDCGNPYCEWKCPLHNYIPNWLNEVTHGRIEKAAEFMYETNPLPEICGRVCPQDRLCEQACTLNTGFGAVTIGEIEKHVTDASLARKWRPAIPYSSNAKSKQSKKVAVIGAGPAGLACADRLARKGIKVEVFDKNPEIGGLLTFGIPGFKLDKNIIRQRKEFLQDIGVVFHLNTSIEQSNINTCSLEARKSFESIKDEFDAIFIATGATKSVTPEISGFDANGIIKAIDYLEGNINFMEGYNKLDTPHHNFNGENVVILGGGDTAMDCARTAIRQKAKSVTCIYRGTKEKMPGSPKEVKNAEQEGVKFIFSYTPLSFISDNGHVVAVKLAPTLLESNDKAAELESSRFSVKKINSGKNISEITLKEKTLTINAEKIVIAFGFKPSPPAWLAENNIQLSDHGLVKINNSAINLKAADLKTVNVKTFDFKTGEQSQQTTIESVYAGGDMVRGADLVVTAIADGVKAAMEISALLELKSIEEKPSITSI